MDDNENWHVLIIEDVGSYRGRDLKHVIPVGHRETAVAQAARTAAEYEPEHPMMPKSRQIFRTSAESWTVNVQGATRSYFFTVQVAQLIQ